MAYCSIQQLEDRLTAPILAYRVPEQGADRLRVLNGYIERASARIDAMLAVRYTVPAPPSAMLADICLAFALWQIEADRGGEGGGIAAGVQVPYDEAVKLLDRLGTGVLALPGVLQPTPGSAAGLAVSSHRSLFSPDSPGMEAY
jgi:phage gp36-like protein